MLELNVLESNVKKRLRLLYLNKGFKNRPQSLLLKMPSLTLEVFLLALRRD
jgi:hypothetical protein